MVIVLFLRGKITRRKYISASSAAHLLMRQLKDAFNNIHASLSRE